MRSYGASTDYVAGIDGLRAIAVLSVITFHFNASLLPGGYTGVDIFFVISGFVISKSLAATEGQSFFSYLLSFYERRLIRIIPALLVCMTVTGIAASQFIPPSWLSNANRTTGPAAYLGLSNFFLLDSIDGYFSERVAFNPFVHTWSLAVEEQFYLIFPLLFFLWLQAYRKQSGRHPASHLVARGLIPGLALLSLAYAVYETAAAPQNAFYLVPSRFWELAAGAMLFQASSHGWHGPRTAGTSLILSVGGALMVCSGILFADAAAFPFPWALMPVAGTVLLISSLLVAPDSRSPIHRIIGHRCVRYVGRISYSLYLWHWPVVTLFRWTVGFSSPVQMGFAAFATILLSMTSYHAVEQPVRHSVFLRRQPKWKVVGGSLILSILAASFTHELLSRPWFFNPSITVHNRDWSSHQVPPEFVGPTTDNQSLGGRTLFVIGDSHAGAYAGMLNIVSKKLGIHVVTTHLSGCPLASLTHRHLDTDFCREFVAQVLHDIEQRAKPKDIVFLASLRSYRLGDQWGQFNSEVAEEIVYGEEGQKARSEALAQAKMLVEQLQGWGLNVLIDAPKPVFRAPPLSVAPTGSTA